VKRRTANPWFKRGTIYRRAMDVLTARDIAERVLVAANIKRPDNDALADLTGSILASLRNHIGKGIQRTNEGAPARWRLKEAASRGAIMNWIGAIFAAALIAIGFALYSDMTMTRCKAGSFAATVRLCDVASKERPTESPWQGHPADQ
jgi:hypothetical protein